MDMDRSILETSFWIIFKRFNFNFIAFFKKGAGLEKPALYIHKTKASLYCSQQKV